MTQRNPCGIPLDEYPECPNCETDMPVVGLRGDQTRDYRCLRCEVDFDA